MRERLRAALAAAVEGQATRMHAVKTRETETLLLAGGRGGCAGSGHAKLGPVRVIAGEMPSGANTTLL